VRIIKSLKSILFKKVSIKILAAALVAATLLPNIAVSANPDLKLNIKNLNFPWGKNQLTKELQKEIQLFKNLGRRDYDGKYIFDTNLKSPPQNNQDLKLFTVYIKEVNRCLQKYYVFREILKNFYRKPFKLKFISEFEEPKYKNTLAIAFNDWSGIEFRSYPNQKYFELYYKDIFRRPRVDIDKIVSAVAAHEVGHVIESIITSIKLVDYKSPPTPEEIKRKIINKAKKKNKNINEEISNYGKSNPREWFAEIFSNLECSKRPNFLASALDDYLKKYIKKNFKCYLHKTGI